MTPDQIKMLFKRYDAGLIKLTMFEEILLWLQPSQRYRAEILESARRRQANG